jgi:hypothetical protein
MNFTFLSGSFFGPNCHIAIETSEPDKLVWIIIVVMNVALLVLVGMGKAS